MKTGIQDFVHKCSSLPYSQQSKDGNKPKSQSNDEWVNNMWHIHAMKHY